MNEQLTRYAHTAAPELCALLEGDAYAFAVLANIVGGRFGPVSKIVTDKARLILCYTCPPYPGWVWTHRDAGEAEFARALALIERELPPEDGYRINMRPELAGYILGTPQGKGLGVQMRLDAYGCETLSRPENMPKGDYFAAGLEDLEEAADFAMASSRETGLDPLAREACEAEMRGFIERKRLFIWKTPEGQNAAMCAVTDSGKLGYIGHVYTPKPLRRKGYAAALTYKVTSAMLAQGICPALCVMSANTAAAACYTRLGYRIMGSFCTVGKT